MTHSNRTRGVRAMAGLLAGLALAGVPAFAKTTAPAPGVDQRTGMMQHGMPNGEAMKPSMMMTEEMQQKMSRTMDNCNHMKASMMQTKVGATTPAAPAYDEYFMGGGGG